MKTYLLFLFTFLTSTAFSQTSNDKKVFLDSLWKETTEGNHKYYRIIKDYYSEQESYKVNDYYASNVLQMEGTFKDKETSYKKGNFIYYYENGNKKSEETFDNSKNIGPYIEWHENGIKKVEGIYIKNEKAFQNDLKIINFWNSENKQLVANGNGYVEDSSEDYMVKGNLKDGLRDGIWTGFNKKVKAKFTENYKNGDFVSGISIDKNNVEHKYNIVEKQPEPKKGMNDFYSFIGKKFKMPNVKESVKGKILLEFIVEKNGEISNIVVLKSLGDEMDSAAIDVLNKYKNWIPGQVQGINVRVRYTIPISINYVTY